jgi:hypothetical protein
MKLFSSDTVKSLTLIKDILAGAIVMATIGGCAGVVVRSEVEDGGWAGFLAGLASLVGVIAAGLILAWAFSRVLTLGDDDPKPKEDFEI